MKSSGPGFGVIWFIGWLFTIGYANLVWWKIILGLVVWPYYLARQFCNNSLYLMIL